MEEKPKKFDESRLVVLYDEQTIKERVKAVAEDIMRDYRDDEPVLCVCVLKGAVMFFADLMKELGGRDVFYDFITLASYGNSTTTGGTVKLVNNLREPVEGRHVLIVEDIVDSGYTLEFLNKFFAEKNALDVKTACLLDKPLGRKVDIKPDYVAFTLDRAPFIVGYGLDYAQYYRNLRHIYEIK